MRAPDFWHGRGPIARLLAPLGALHGLSVAIKARATPPDTGVPVICVGNLTAGGSGKTPIAIAIAQILREQGRNPFFLTRGYGGSAHGPLLVNSTDSAAVTGDEALLLAHHAPTIVARDRLLGARLAKDNGAQVIVMDDGHQNFTIAKTLSLVVVDGHTGFGNGFQIPAGPLREPVRQGLSRADAVVVMGDGTPDLHGYYGTVLRAHVKTDGAPFIGKRVFAFAGIGQPQKFFDALAQTGAQLTGQRAFGDHHPYRDDEIRALRAMAGDALLVTTQKDFARMTNAQRDGIQVLKAAAVFDQPDIVTRLLDSRLGPV